MAIAFYGLGQIVSPPLAAMLLHRSGDAELGFTRSLAIAVAALVTGALLYLWMGRAFPRL